MTALTNQVQKPAVPLVLTRWIFLRLLALVYLVAFASLRPQILGLIGSDGIMPAAAYLQQAHAGLGGSCYSQIPTLFWFNSHDGALLLTCDAGIVLSITVLCGVAPVPGFVGLWALYLSSVNVGQPFLAFQWDTLLLEAGFCAIVLAPWNLLARFSKEAPPPALAIWLIRFLVFRLMFMSGVVKLASGDPTWHNLTALSYHYETQPLPTPAAWYLFHLPLRLHRLGTFATLAIELACPFLMFFGRRARLVQAAIFAAFQTGIMLTGNYGFFNFLTVVLYVGLLDDGILRRLCPRRFKNLLPAEPVDRPKPIRPHSWLVVSLSVVILGMGCLQLVSSLAPEFMPQSSASVLDAFAPFYLVNSYGLFAVMTTSRPEISLQGSNDGITWQTYRFRYMNQEPRWIAPYMPRLDWQMWFVPLDPDGADGWLSNLTTRLLQGSPDVIGLFDGNPFPKLPPRYIRAMISNYRFTSMNEHGRTGQEWRHDEGAVFLGPVTSQ
jgi:hypothetical protein